MKVISVYNIKGGVGKTAAAVNIAYFAGKSGLKTLVWDLDPQAACTYYFRVKPHIKKDVGRMIEKGSSPDKSVKATDFDNVHLLPSDFSYRNLDLLLDSQKKPKKVLSRAFAKAFDGYDILIIDSPPGIGLLSENIIRASDILLVPVIPTVLSVRTCGMLMEHLGDEEIDEVCVCAFFSMLDRRRKMHREIADSFAEKGVKLLKNSIPYSADVEKMGTHRAPVAEFAPNSSAAESFAGLWDEIHSIIK
jgi:cellulose biosynthesis protein BcsQ